MLGAMSHLILDELYSIEWHRGRVRLKKSFGSAIKLWSSSAWANISAWGKLTLVLLLILGEPMVLQQYGNISPLAIRHQSWNTHEHNQLVNSDRWPLQNGPTWNKDGQDQNGQESFLSDPTIDQTVYDTARRIWRNIRE